MKCFHVVLFIVFPELRAKFLASTFYRYFSISFSVTSHFAEPLCTAACKGFSADILCLATCVIQIISANVRVCVMDKRITYIVLKYNIVAYGNSFFFLNDQKFFTVWQNVLFTLLDYNYFFCHITFIFNDFKFRCWRKYVCFLF